MNHKLKRLHSQGVTLALGQNQISHSFEMTIGFSCHLEEGARNLSGSGILCAIVIEPLPFA